MAQRCRLGTRIAAHALARAKFIAREFGRWRFGVGRDGHSRCARDQPLYEIIISMFYADHARPHFHARCGSESIAVEIDGDGIRGSFPPNRLPLVFEWRDLHRPDLRANWERLRRGESPLSIVPLQ